MLTVRMEGPSQAWLDGHHQTQGENCNVDRWLYVNITRQKNKPDQPTP